MLARLKLLMLNKMHVTSVLAADQLELVQCDSVPPAAHQTPLYLLLE